MTALKEKELHDVLETIHDRYGYDFSEYSTPFLQRRLERVFKKTQVQTVEELRSHIIGDKWFFINQIIGEFSIGFTQLFRDPEFYKALHKKMMPRLDTYPTIRIWSAGCSTGEEAYSVAMLLEANGLYEKSRIYCTDINKKALRQAAKGVYPATVLEKENISWLKNLNMDMSGYYKRNGDMITFSESIKKNMVFSFHNLVSDQSFNEFQLILCRNVLIYFNDNLKNKVWQLMHESLCPFGFLALGTNETVMFTEWEKHFQTIDSQNKIYKKLS